LLTNIYLSEKDPNAPLRKDHHGHDQLPAEESDSVGFLINNAENLFWIKFLFAEEFALFNMIASNVMATFNPIREYLSDPTFYNALPGPGEPPTHVYNVQPGDSLSRIAQLFYGNANRWPVIYAANRDVVGPNPNLIFPGQTLDIP
jgi:nucleoid-associated protein YgaU